MMAQGGARRSRSSMGTIPVTNPPVQALRPLGLRAHAFAVDESLIDATTDGLELAD